jgi:hypothetical protein
MDYTCSRHPGYKAVLPPRDRTCNGCWVVWRAKRLKLVKKEEGQTIPSPKVGARS